MEQKDFDIYEILKGAPVGTPLYTPMCGNVLLSYLATNKEAGEAIWTENKNGEYSFNKNGRWMEGGEVMLFPSDRMREWRKLAWKKGDVLVIKVITHASSLKSLTIIHIQLSQVSCTIK